MGPSQLPGRAPPSVEAVRGPQLLAGQSRRPGAVQLESSGPRVRITQRWLRSLFPAVVVWVVAAGQA